MRPERQRRPRGRDPELEPQPRARAALRISLIPKAVSARSTTWFVLCSVIAALYLAREFLLPIAFAVFVAFVLAPLVRRLTRAGVPRLAATALTMAAVAVLVSAVGWMLVSQVRGVGDRLPEYRVNVRSKVADVRSTLGRKVEQAMTAVRELGSDLSDPAAPEASDPAPSPTPASSNGLEGSTIQAALGSMVDLSAFTALVLVFAWVMLLRWEDLRDRLLSLAGHGDLDAATRAAREASVRVSGYLRRQLLVNAMHGTVMGLLLWWIGVPNPLVWGLLGATLRFVPYLGPIVSTLAPIVVSFASSEGWSQTWITAGTLISLELVTNNVLEPWIYGSGTGVSPLALLVSAAFWTWMWGPLGLVLSTPLTACLLVLGKHFPGLRFLDLLFGDEPAMSPRLRIYRRLLAGDPDEAWEILRNDVAHGSLVEASDRTLLPALGLAGAAHNDGRIDTESRDRVGALAHGLADELDDLPRPPSIPVPPGAAHVLCLPARDAFDAVGSRILARELTLQGLRATSVAPALLLAEVLETIRRGEVDAVVISSVVPTQFLLVRSLCKRVLALEPRVEILVGFWGEELPLQELTQRLPSSPQVHVATTLAQALAWSVEASTRIVARRASRVSSA